MVVAIDMSNALNYHEQFTTLQFQPIEMATNTQKHLAAMPLQQMSQPPPTTQIQILEFSRPVRKITAVIIIIIYSNTGGGMLVLNDSPNHKGQY